MSIYEKHNDSDEKVRVIDSHTGGEPTRTIIEGGPDLGTGTLAERRIIFRDNFDSFRTAVINEPRGGDAWVGALVCKPDHPKAEFGVIFFNNVGVLNMCGHGTIGLAASLAHINWISAGSHFIDTPAGLVEINIHDANRVSLKNVSSYRFKKNVVLETKDFGSIVGDIAWGGNWFFLVKSQVEDIDPSNIPKLTSLAKSIRRELKITNITGKDSAEIDHIELFGAATKNADSRNFTLCPGDAFDRSPCGTGTSAKIACLIEDGELKPGEKWLQESVLGSIFEARGFLVHGKIFPEITGEAFVNSEALLILNPKDPFCMGIKF